MESSLRESAGPSAQNLDLRRVLIFCGFAFAISGSAAIYVALTGGLTDGMTGTTVLILAAWYMPGPALANLLTRWVTGEGFGDLWLRPKLRQGWRAWVGAWFLPGLLTLAGIAVYFVVFPQHYDGSLGTVQRLLEQAAVQTGQVVPISPWAFVALQTVQALLIAPLLNSLASLGEEFGWRAYLQQKLMVLGWRQAMVWMGVIWGVWHWPILALGYNYGFDYPGAPWLGMLAFVWFTFTFGTILGWLTLHGQSVWPAVIGHGAFNGIAGLAVLFSQGDPHPVLGPAPIGLVGGLLFTVVGLWLWLRTPPSA
jgi:uncharacterized protein